MEKYYFKEDKLLANAKELKKELRETIDSKEREIKSLISDLYLYKGLPQYMKKKLFRIENDTRTLVDILNIVFVEEENDE